MAANFTTANSRPGTGLQNATSGGARSSTGSIYSVFGDYDREARQRKYMIAECEDTIEGLKRALTDLENKRKSLSTETEKLQLEAKACEAHYQNRLKEKTLIEKDYQKLSSEMDTVVDGKCAKQALLKKIKIIHQEKLELSATKEKEHTNAYMRNPDIARLHAMKNKCEESDLKCTESKRILQLQCQELEAVTIRKAEEWETFVKKCIKMAEADRDVRNKYKLLDECRKECKKAQKRPVLTPLNVGQGEWRNANSQVVSLPTMTTSQKLLQREPLSKKLSSVVAPRFKRPTSFQQMDRFLKNRDTWSMLNKKTAEAKNPLQSLPVPGTPVPARSNTSNLLFQLRARMRSPVMITPMRQRPDTPRVYAGIAQNITNPIAQPTQLNVAVPEPEHEILSENVVNQASSTPTEVIITRTTCQITESMDIDQGNNPEKVAFSNENLEVIQKEIQNSDNHMVPQSLPLTKNVSAEIPSSSFTIPTNASSPEPSFDYFGFSAEPTGASKKSGDYFSSMPSSSDGGSSDNFFNW